MNKFKPFGQQFQPEGENCMVGHTPITLGSVVFEGKNVVAITEVVNHNLYLLEAEYGSEEHPIRIASMSIAMGATQNFWVGVVYERTFDAR